MVKCNYCLFLKNGDVAYSHKDLVRKKFSVSSEIIISGSVSCKVPQKHPLQLQAGIYEHKDGYAITGDICDNYGVVEDFDIPHLSFAVPISYCPMCGRKLEKRKEKKP